MTGYYGYDSSVYYAAADAFIHGRMPYRDFVLVHPPGIVLVDSPFAALGSLTTDRIGFAAANISFAIIGAISAVLVTRVACVFGVPRRAALVGGAVYALWFGSIVAEYNARLEPIGCFFLLCGLLALGHAQAATKTGLQRRAGRLSVLAGVSLGCAMSVKIWWLVPVVLIVGWQLIVERDRRRAGRMALGILLAGAVIDLPFFLIAGSDMWRLVVLDQLGRPVNTSPLNDFGYMVLGREASYATKSGLTIAVVLGAVAVAVLVWRSWRYRAGRMIAVILVAQLLQIAVEPSFFTFYADFITVALALMVAMAVAPAPQRVVTTTRLWQRVGALSLAVELAMAISLVWLQPRNLVEPFPSNQLRAAGERFRCVISDSPLALIDMNVLSPEFHRGCADIVDIVGLHMDLLRGHPRADPAVTRQWNADMLAYLRSGDAVVLVRKPRALELWNVTMRKIERDGLVAKYQQRPLYRVRQAAIRHDGPYADLLPR